MEEYFNYNNIFLIKNELELLEYTSINYYAIIIKKISSHFCIYL